jgi:hypothetical protein
VNDCALCPRLSGLTGLVLRSPAAKHAWVITHTSLNDRALCPRLIAQYLQVRAALLLSWAVLKWKQPFSPPTGNVVKRRHLFCSAILTWERSFALQP